MCVNADARPCSELAASAVVDVADAACSGLCAGVFFLQRAVSRLYLLNLGDMVLEVLSLAFGPRF